MDLFDAHSFFENTTRELFYAGLLRGREAWFPFCLVSDPKQGDGLDTLAVSYSYQSLARMVKDYTGRIPQIEETLIHCMTRDEILNLMRDYGLKIIALVDGEGDHGECDCGCGCT